MLYGLDLKTAKFHNPPGTRTGIVRLATVSKRLVICEYMIDNGIHQIAYTQYEKKDKADDSQGPFKSGATM